MNDKAMNVELEPTRLETREVGSDKAMNLRRWERHVKSTKTKMKIKESGWGKARILD